jgi:regulator of protease activity HflC (stomatin/prohibitin superfamily)
MEIAVALVVIAALAAAAWAAARLLERVTVYEYERGLLYERGRFVRLLGPGQYWLLRTHSRVTKVDVRPRVVTVPGQEVITADGVSVRISLTTEYELADPVTAINTHGDYARAYYAALQDALREVVGATPVDELLERRGAVGEQLAERTREAAERLGLRPLGVGVRDFMFPGELKRTFAQVVSARKEGLAALERARGETAALRNLANAARVLEGRPALMQLRLLQELGKTGGNTVVLGLPSSTTPLPLRRPEELEEAEPDTRPGSDE